MGAVYMGTLSYTRVGICPSGLLKGYKRLEHTREHAPPGGNHRFYTPSCREGLFSESQRTRAGCSSETPLPVKSSNPSQAMAIARITSVSGSGRKLMRAPTMRIIAAARG